MLTVQNLSVAFTMYDVGLVQRQLTVITDLDLTVAPGEVVAVVGSSGSGKSLLAHAVLGILPANAQVAGTMTFQGEPLTPVRQAQLRGRTIALIPQSVAFLDPLMRVGRQVQRAAELSGVPAKIKVSAQGKVFTRYGLAALVSRLFPFQISGGMARRVLTATAAVGNAKLLIADEPTPGLHPDAVAETLSHLRQLADEGRGVILITHDIDAALRIANRVAVFYAGTTVEVAHAADFQGAGAALRHPYTKALWRALPQQEFIPVPGAQPTPDALPAGCLFAPRCPLVTAACTTARPPMRSLRAGLVRCVHAV
ncbi:MAG: ABC transporter ATP-binding protein [Caldilineaceae bacterium]|nr:ABC transporter ATP-binding protein [Caldilineaceae bacterium]